MAATPRPAWETRHTADSVATNRACKYMVRSAQNVQFRFARRALRSHA